MTSSNLSTCVRVTRVTFAVHEGAKMETLTDMYKSSESHIQFVCKVHDKKRNKIICLLDTLLGFHNNKIGRETAWIFV